MSKRHYRKYTDQDVINYSKEVKSIASLLKRLNLRIVGGNYINIKKILQRLNVDTTHWTGQGWNKDEQLKDFKDYTRSGNLKRHLIKKRGCQCENCKRKSWLKEPITLELHHIDGDRTNNQINNLQLLCPNCHSITNNWRGRKV